MLKLNAFSLFELAVVIIIISAMVIGIASTKTMINKSRLANAQLLTQKSLINDISDDLVAWYETSLESSFLSNEIQTNESNISTWKDNNINAINKNNATNSNVSNQPKYYQNLFYNSIPGLRFDGNNDFLNLSCNKIAKSSYTIFVVEQRGSNKNDNYFIGGSYINPNETIHLGYKTNTIISHGHNSSDFDISTNGFTSLNPKIFTFVYNYLSGKQITINGKNKNSNNSQTSSLLSCNAVAIGRYNTNYYYMGDLAEIIIFKRSLKTEEIVAIENYLGSKYGISVS